ncbi:MAG: hypothetical protein JXP34_12230 [Planctomycetes bacterium]|nr:hypothetical protein [Planctomycetota bacterium]
MENPWVRAAVLLCLFAAASPAQDIIERAIDVNPGAAGSGPSYMTVFDDALYFRANSAPHAADAELWRFDGTEAELAAEIRPGLDGSSPTDLAVFDGMLYFGASDGTGAMRMWRFDGTNAELAPGSDAKPGTTQAFFPFGGTLYFRAFRSGFGIELWTFDGTTQRILDLFPGSGSSYPQHFVAFQGALYFNACATPGEGTELYRLEGTTAVKAAEIRPEGSSPEWPCVMGDALYFSAYDDETGRELWSYDGIRATRLTDIAPGSASSNPSSLAAYRGAIYFCADDGIAGAELWRFDGQAAEMVANINPTPYVPDIDPVHHAWPSDLFVFHDVLYFAADDGVHGRELWSYDGVEARLVSDINPGPYGSYPGGFVAYRDALYFAADDGQAGSELANVLYRMVEKGTPETSFVRGDANADGRRDIADPVSILFFIFAQADAPPCEKSADVDDSGDLGIGDAIGLLNYLFAEAAPPPAPFDACGTDATPDDLPCASFPACP